MKQIQRVPKGENYWSIIHTEKGFTPFEFEELNDTYDDNDFSIGNYFHNEGEAESVAKKLRAVFKGADVIEMPSEEEAEAKGERQLELSVACDDKWTEEAYLDGFADCLHWLKSKVK